MTVTRMLAVVLVCGVVSASALSAAERQMMQPLVPADKLAEARALASPLPDSAEILEKGKTLSTAKAPASIATAKTDRATAWRQSASIPRRVIFNTMDSGGIGQKARFTGSSSTARPVRP